MKNMKTLFKLMTAVILTTVSTSSLIACQSDDNLKMNIQVQKDFNFWPNKKLVYFIKMTWEIKLSFLIVKQL